MTRYYSVDTGYTTTVKQHLVFAAIAAAMHNAISKSVWLGGAEYTFETEDELIAFEEELAAYTNQQAFLDRLDDDEKAALCI